MRWPTDTFEAKYYYHYWRPVTAIRTADSDGNPLTIADLLWTPLQLTYPIPDYDSAHATEGGAAAEVQKEFFGTDAIGFSQCRPDAAVRSTLHRSGADTTVVFDFLGGRRGKRYSRILVGIHFRDAADEGIQYGRKIGKRAVDAFLRPVR